MVRSAREYSNPTFSVTVNMKMRITEVDRGTFTPFVFTISWSNGRRMYKVFLLLVRSNFTSRIGNKVDFVLFGSILLCLCGSRT